MKHELRHLFSLAPLNGRYQLTLNNIGFPTAAYADLELAMKRGRVKSTAKNVRFVTLRDTHANVLLGTFIDGGFKSLEKTA